MTHCLMVAAAQLRGCLCGHHRCQVHSHEAACPMAGCQVSDCCPVSRASHWRVTSQGQPRTSLKRSMSLLRRQHSLALLQGSVCGPLVYRLDVLCPLLDSLTSACVERSCTIHANAQQGWRLLQANLAALCACRQTKQQSNTLPRQMLLLWGVKPLSTRAASQSQPWCGTMRGPESLTSVQQLHCLLRRGCEPAD